MCEIKAGCPWWSMNYEANFLILYTLWFFLSFFLSFWETIQYDSSMIDGSLLFPCCFWEYIVEIEGGRFFLMRLLSLRHRHYLLPHHVVNLWLPPGSEYGNGIAMDGESNENKFLNAEFKGLIWWTSQGRRQGRQRSASLCCPDDHKALECPTKNIDLTGTEL